MAPTTVDSSRSIAAPPDTVWSLLAEETAMARWLLPPALGATLRRSPSDLLSVDMGFMAPPLARIEYHDAPPSLLLVGLPDEKTTVEFTLYRESTGGSQVVLRVYGVERDRSAVAVDAAGKVLTNLEAAALGAELPWPEGYIAALFGYRLDGPDRWGVERSVYIPAPVERVWAAVTTPAGIEGWFSPGTAWTLTDLAPEGRLFVRDAQTGAELYTQIVDRVEAPNLLRLRGIADDSGASDWSDYVLTPEEDGTRIALANYGYERLPVEMRSATQEQNAFGFGMVMENLRAHVLEEPLPYPGGF